MLFILVVFSLIARGNSLVPESCFYSQRVTFFNGNSVASPSRPSGYEFDVIWDSPQASIFNSSLFYTTAQNQRHIFLKYYANIINTTYTYGKVEINPINGSEIVSITMNIVLLKSCKGTARLILHQVNNIQLTSLQKNININTGVTFTGNILNYKTEAFVTDFDGYPNNGSASYGFYLVISPIVLNTNIQSLLLGASSGDPANSVYLNSFRFTYILVDIYSFQVTPITQNHVNLWLSNQMYIQVSNDLSPLADKKCMLGMKYYVLINTIIENYSITLSNSSNYTLIYNYHRNPGANFLPSMFCFGYCPEGMGRSTSNTCSSCPKLSLTCSNNSYSLTCISGYYPQPTTTGIQNCFFCMPACKICSNYSSCMLCQPTNLLTEQNDCRSCPQNSWLAGGICSSVPGCSLAQSAAGLSVCRFCNPQELFEIYPIDKKCVCIKGYQLKNGKCIDYCGDGLIFDQECDDGNTANRDGCSFQCKQEKGYNCSRKDAESPSKCVFIDKISIELISIERVNLENRLILVFRVLPVHFIGLLSNQIRGRIEANATLKIDSLTADGSLITVEASFDEDVENKQAIFIMNINDPLIDQMYVTAQIKLQAKQKLVKLSKIQLAKTIKYLFSSIIVFVLLIFLLSLRFHKMIGLQTILPFQIICFSYLLNRDETQLFSLFSYYAGSALNFAFYTNGFSAAQSSYVNLSFNQYNQNSSLLFAFFISYPTFLISFFGFIIHFIQKKSFYYKKIQNFAYLWHNRISLPLNSWLLIPLLILNSTIAINNNKVIFHHSLLNIECIILVVIIFYQWRAIFSIKSSFVQANKKYSLYIPYYMSLHFLISLFLSASHLGIIIFFEQWIILLYLISLLGFIYYRPYRSFLHNAGLFVGFIQVISFQAWSILRNGNASYRTEENQIFGLFICFGLAAAAIILAALRIIFEAIRICKQNDQTKSKEDFCSKQPQNNINICLKQSMDLTTRYQTNAIIPQYLKNQNSRCFEPIHHEIFYPVQKDDYSQLKKYLMEKMQKAIKKRKIRNVNS